MHGMGKSRIYSQAPIAEAIIDIRADLPKTVTVADLERCCTGQEAAYPTRSALNQATGQIQLGPSFSTTTQTRPLGYICTAADQKRSFQARLDGFTMNRLAPYTNWEGFRDEARKVWEAYRAAVSPEKVTRVAVRYINRLDLPQPVMDLKDYFRTFPEVSADLPQPAGGGFFMQVVIPQEDIRSVVILTEAATEEPGPNLSSIILDIDLFRTVDIPLDDEGVWGLFETLRRRKNEIFEACITDRTRELIG